MSASVPLSNLQGLLVKTEQLKTKFAKVCPTDDQWNILSELTSNLSKAVKEIYDEIGTLKELCTEQAWKESNEHRLHAQSLRGDLFAGRLKQPAIFRRNIITIF
jgi:hypothetical protein